MKRNKGTILALVIVAALVVFTIFDTKKAEKKEQQERDAKLLFKISASEIAKIELEDKDPARVLEKKEGVWHLTAPIEDLVDMQELTSVLEAIEHETALDTVSEDANDLATFGLEKPGLVVKVTNDKGETQLVRFGSVSTFDGNLYVQRGDEKKVWVTGTGLEAQLSKKLTEWRDKHLYRGPKERMFTSIDLEERDAKGKTKHHLRLVKRDKEWTMSGYDIPIEIAAVEAFIEQVRALRALDFTDRDKKDAAARKDEKLDPPRIKVSLGDGKAEPYTVEIGPPLVDADKAPHAATSSDLPKIVSVYGAAVSTIEKRPEDFLDRKSPFRYQVNDAARIELNVPRASPPYEAVFEKKGPDWVLVSSKTPTGGLQKDFNGTKLNDVLTRMSVLEAVRFLEPIDGPGPAAKAQLDSSIRLLKKDGAVEFEMKWGKPVTVKPNADDPEATYVPASTSSSKRLVAIPQGSLEGLGLTDLFSTTTEAKK